MFTLEKENNSNLLSNRDVFRRFEKKIFSPNFLIESGKDEIERERKFLLTGRTHRRCERKCDQDKSKTLASLVRDCWKSDNFPGKKHCKISKNFFLRFFERLDLKRNRFCPSRDRLLDSTDKNKKNLEDFGEKFSLKIEKKIRFCFSLKIRWENFAFGD